jgi:Phosphoinositide phospholipase C, Ca2+-dependent
MRQLRRLPWLFALALCADAWSECNHEGSGVPGTDCAKRWIDDNVRLNDLTSIGTHNSYKLAIPEAELTLLRKRSSEQAIGLDYAHAPLTQQLDGGARQLELDVYVDAEGGRFAHPLGPRLTGSHLDSHTAAELSRPGFKVMHFPDVDFRSNCVRFVSCLAMIRAWSRAHPTHIPLLILINAKDEPARVPGAAPVAPFDAAAFDALDAEIASVFSTNELITPDQVRGRQATLREAVLAGSWPKLRDARGRILIALDDTPAKVALYRGDRRSLEGRLMFVNTEESSPDAAYLTLNDPLGDRERISAAVGAGFLVRTRADADTREARAGDVRRRGAALASGAQYVSTDYMQADPRFGEYSVELPGKAVAVCNPLRANRCAGRVIEE